MVLSKYDLDSGDLLHCHLLVITIDAPLGLHEQLLMLSHILSKRLQYSFETPTIVSQRLCKSYSVPTCFKRSVNI